MLENYGIIYAVAITVIISLDYLLQPKIKAIAIIATVLCKIYLGAFI